MIIDIGARRIRATYASSFNHTALTIRRLVAIPLADYPVCEPDWFAEFVGSRADDIGRRKDDVAHLRSYRRSFPEAAPLSFPDAF